MDFAILECRLGVTFQDRSFLKQALTHRSFINEHRTWPLGHNERLEFLGDAVLELIVTEFLFKKYPRQPEGLLTSYRSSLVNITVLAEIAVELGLNDFLLISKGEAKDTGRARQLILGNSFEAVVGALYLDQGYEAAQQLVAKYLLPKIDAIVTKGLWRDPKGQLQEATQKHLQLAPNYEVLEQSGPDHNRQFVVGVYFGPDLIAKGTGPAKQLAEVEAAKAALNLKGWSSIIAEAGSHDDRYFKSKDY